MGKENIDTLRTNVFFGLEKVDEALPKLATVTEQLEGVVGSLRDVSEGSSQPDLEAVIAAVQSALNSVASVRASVMATKEATQRYIHSV